MFLSFDVLANASSLGLFAVLLGVTRCRALDEGSAESTQRAPGVEARGGTDGQRGAGRVRRLLR
jgi:hypothetical protein